MIAKISSFLSASLSVLAFCTSSVCSSADVSKPGERASTAPAVIREFIAVPSPLFIYRFQLARQRGKIINRVNPLTKLNQSSVQQFLHTLLGMEDHGITQATGSPW